MAELDRVLEACLKDIRLGRATFEDCLRRYPEHAAALRPLLIQAESLLRTQPAVDETQRARMRARLTKHMQQHPRQPASLRRLLAPAATLRWATAAVLAVMLAFGSLTAVAQASAPGSVLHPLKLASERAWGALTGRDADYYRWLSDRRLTELVRSAETEYRQTALAAYAQSLAVLGQALSEAPAPSNQNWLAEHVQSLRSLGFSQPQIVELISPVGGQLIVPASTPSPPAHTGTPVSPSVVPSPGILDGFLPTPALP